MSKETPHTPGDGIRSMRTSNIFRAVNFELYVKPNSVIMALGLIAITGSAAYIIYMRQKYASLGYYVAVKDDGTESFVKKKSKWD